MAVSKGNGEVQSDDLGARRRPAVEDRGIVSDAHYCGPWGPEDTPHCTGLGVTHCFPGPVTDGLDVHQAGPGYVSAVRAPQRPSGLPCAGWVGGTPGTPRGGPSLLTLPQPPQKRGNVLWPFTFLSGVDSHPLARSHGPAQGPRPWGPPPVPPGGPRSLGASSADTSAARPTEQPRLGRPQRGSRSHRPRLKPNPPGAAVAANATCGCSVLPQPQRVLTCC